MASTSPEPSPEPLSPPATEEAKGKRLKLEPEWPDPRKMTLDEVKAMYDDASFGFSTLVGRSGIVYKNKAYIKREEAVEEYRKQARLLGAFDDRSKLPPNPGLLGGIGGSYISDHNRPELVCLSKAALDKYNAENQGANFEFVELVRANRQAVDGFMYYMTIEAKDEVDGTTHTFQAKVFHHPRNMEVEVKMCQMKPN